MASRSFRTNGVRCAGLAAAHAVMFVLAFALACAATAGAQTVASRTATPDQSQTADYVGIATCASCHEGQRKGYQESPHARAWDPRTPAAARGCETCHGPGKGHVEDPGAKNRLRNFLTMSPRDVSDACMGCHNRQEHASWQGSMHDARNLTCVACHSIHTPKSEERQLKQASITATCAQCHRDKAARLQGSAHMPVREGKMECTSCHNPHGSTNVRLLRTGSDVTSFCVSCHTEKRGPFLWEHPSVRENCATCHDPHGSSNDRMLVARLPMLCQRCHIFTRHPSTDYDNVALAARNVHMISRGCVNCHSNIHGSNHPSGARFQR